MWVFLGFGYPNPNRFWAVDGLTAEWVPEHNGVPWWGGWLVGSQTKWLQYSPARRRLAPSLEMETQGLLCVCVWLCVCDWLCVWLCVYFDVSLRGKYIPWNNNWLMRKWVWPKMAAMSWITLCKDVSVCAGEALNQSSLNTLNHELPSQEIKKTGYDQVKVKNREAKECSTSPRDDERRPGDQVFT